MIITINFVGVGDYVSIPQINVYLYGLLLTIIKFSLLLFFSCFKQKGYSLKANYTNTS